MDLGLTPELIRNGLLIYLLLVATLCLRAYAQAWLADRMGDPTPHQEGRLTLNPLPHMDLFGSVLLPLLCIFFLQPNLRSISFFMAWAKPVPINPSYFAHPWRGYMFTQLANPLMSILLATLAAVAGGIVYHFDPRFLEIFGPMIVLNASLIVIDFIPLPPLPGGMLLKHFGVITEDTFWAISRWTGLVLIIAFQIPVFRSLLGFLIGLVALPFGLLLELIAR